MENIETIIAVITGGSGIIVAIVGFMVKYIIRPLSSFKNTVNNTLAAHTEILKELKVNGGKSIKDVVNTVQTDLKFITASIKSMKLDLDKITALMRASFELDNDGIFMADSLGSCFYFNKKYLEIAGLNYNEALAYGWANSIHPQDKEKIIRIWSESIKNRSNATLKYRYKNLRTNRVHWCRVSWQVQVQEDKDNTLIIFGRVTLLKEKND
jgi:PAS domain S-box-containing protein